MKQILFTLTMLISYFIADSQDKVNEIKPLTSSYKDIATLTSCWGITFRTSKDSIIRIIKSRINKSPIPQSDKDLLIYRDCYFGSNKAKEIDLLFEEGFYYGATIILQPEKSPMLFDFYNSLKDEISSKYFKPQKDIESYKFPYEKGDGHVMTAILGGYATIGCIWEFNKSEKTMGNGKILLICDSDGSLHLSYMDGFISELAESKQKKDSQSDY